MTAVPCSTSFGGGAAGQPPLEPTLGLALEPLPRRWIGLGPFRSNLACFLKDGSGLDHSVAANDRHLLLIKRHRKKERRMLMSGCPALTALTSSSGYLGLGTQGGGGDIFASSCAAEKNTLSCSRLLLSSEVSCSWLGFSSDCCWKHGVLCLGDAGGVPFSDSHCIGGSEAACWRGGSRR